MTRGRPPAAVLFDMFDTLVRLDRGRLPATRIGDREVRSSVPALHRLAWPALTTRGLPEFYEAFRWSFEEAERLRAGSHREVPAPERFRLFYRRLGLDPEAVPEALTAQLLDAHMACLAEVAEPMPGVDELLRWLEGRYRLGIVSNFDYTPTVERILHRLGLGHRFELVVVSDAVGWRKPRPDIFQEAFRGLGVSAGECLFVGDRVDIDVAGARAVGMEVAWLNVARARVPAGLPVPEFDLGGLTDLRGILDGRSRGS